VGSLWRLWFVFGQREGVNGRRMGGGGWLGRDRLRFRVYCVFIFLNYSQIIFIYNLFSQLFFYL